MEVALIDFYSHKVANTILYALLEDALYSCEVQNRQGRSRASLMKMIFNTFLETLLLHKEERRKNVIRHLIIFVTLSFVHQYLLKTEKNNKNRKV